MGFFVYILECSDGTFYVGSTNNLEKRLYQHNNLKSGATYTKGRRPVKLLYSENLPTFREARQREYQLKTLSRQEKLDLIQSIQ